MQQREPREHDARFLKALRRLPCLVCGSWRQIEAAHIRVTSAEWAQKTGARTGAGAGEKPHDRWALPLCAHHHREGADAEHVIGTLAFWTQHKKDPHAIAAALYEAFPNERRMAAVIANARAGNIFDLSAKAPNGFRQPPRHTFYRDDRR